MTLADERSSTNHANLKLCFIQNIYHGQNQKTEGRLKNIIRYNEKPEMFNQ
jgi:hypothetical protein